VPKLPLGSGVYAFLVDGVPVYVGRTADFSNRLSAVNYGLISPKNCYVTGQSTNGKINSRVLLSAKAGREISLSRFA
jgi:hypothetical protein